MPGTLVQGSSLGAWGFTNTGTGTGSLSVTWAQGRTSGSRLFLAVASDGTGSTPSGWSLAKSQINNSAIYLYYRDSDNTATDAPTWSNAAASCIAWAEYTGLTTAVAPDQTAGTGSGTGSTTRSTGTTLTTAQADELAIAVWSWSRNGVAPTWSGQTNSFTELTDDGTVRVGSQNVGLSVATKALAATGTVESTATLSGSFASGALVATFKAAAGTKAPPPHRQRTRFFNRAR